MLARLVEFSFFVNRILSKYSYKDKNKCFSCDSFETEYKNHHKKNLIFFYYFLNGDPTKDIIVKLI